MSRDALLTKLKEIEYEMASLEEYCNALKARNRMLVDWYVNGDILNPIGKEQKKLQKEMDKSKKRYDKLSQQAFKIRRQLGSI